MNVQQSSANYAQSTYSQFNYRPPTASNGTTPNPTPDPAPAPAQAPAQQPGLRRKPKPGDSEYDKDRKDCIAWANEQMKGSAQARLYNERIRQTSDFETELQLRQKLEELLLGYLDQCMEKKGWQAESRDIPK
jgi:hypothetical protein